MPEAVSPHWYFDTVTLSNFALAGRLDLLIRRYGHRALITPEVLDEVSDGVVAGFTDLHTIEAAVAAGRLTGAASLAAGERVLYRELLETLSPGEASCIASARARGGIVVTDDRAARARCEERGLAITGTIGILLACTRDGTLSAAEGDATLQAMIDTGYYSPVRRLSDVL